MTYGVFNIDTKELFKFDKYEDALDGYLHLLKDQMKEDDYKFRYYSELYLIHINDNNKVELFEQLNWRMHNTKIDLDNLDDVDFG